MAFELERRLFRIDRWRLPVAYGVPLRSIGYAVLALGAVIVAGRLPLIGASLAMVAAPVRLVLVPCAVAYALSRICVDGRHAHAAGTALLRHCLGPRRVVACRRERATRAVISEITFSPDDHASRYRRAVVIGPARLVLRYPVHGHVRGRTLTLTQASPRPMRGGKEVCVRPGGRVWLC